MFGINTAPPPNAALVYQTFRVHFVEKLARRKSLGTRATECLLLVSTSPLYAPIWAPKGNRRLPRMYCMYILNLHRAYGDYYRACL